MLPTELSWDYYALSRIPLTMNKERPLVDIEIFKFDLLNVNELVSRQLRLGSLPVSRLRK